MAQTKLNMLLQVRRDNVFNSTYKLEAGEPGFEISTNILKVGDGVKTWAELPFANEAQVAALIKVTDDKVVALTESVNKLNDTYATDAEVEGVRAALDAAKLDKTTYNAYVEAHQNDYTNTQIDEAVAGAKTHAETKIAEFKTGTFDPVAADVATIKGDYTTAAQAGTIAQGKVDTFNTNTIVPLAERVTAAENTLKTHGDIVTHNVAEFATAAQGAKADAAAVKTEVDAALLLKADKSVVDAMYTNAQIDQLVQGAKDYADTNDANTEYHVEYDATNKKIKLVAGADASKMEIDATDFIKDGMIESVALSEDGLNLVITWNTDADKGENNVTTIPLTGLVDIYTGVAGDRITVAVSSDDKISADLVAGSITKNYLDSGVQTSLGLADTALQAADLGAYAKTADVVTNEEFTAFEATNTAAINAKLDKSTFEAFNNGTSKTVAAIEADIVAKAGAAESAAKGHANDLNTAMDARVAKLENNDADYATKTYVDTQDADILAQAKAYADGKEHKNTTYTVAATANALEFTVTPSEGDAQTVTLVAPTVDTGVMSIAAGNDIVVTPGENGAVTVAHETFTTGTYEKTPTSSDKTGDVYMMTGVTVDNGHVTGANVQSLAHALEALTFILDGGTSK